MDLDALLIAETWLTGNVSHQKSVGEETPARYSFHRGGVSILLRDVLV